MSSTLRLRPEGKLGAEWIRTQRINYIYRGHCERSEAISFLEKDCHVILIHTGFLARRHNAGKEDGKNERQGVEVLVMA